MRLPNKLSIAATVLGLGGLTGVAMSSGASKRDRSGTPAADIRTVTVQQTIHRYHQVLAAGSPNGIGGGVKLVASYKGATARVATRPSGHRGTSGVTASPSKTVKTGPSGKHSTKAGGKRSSSGASTAPKTRPSGTPEHTSSTKTTPSPTTKPSGSAGSPETTGTTPAASPTTKSSGATTTPTETTAGETTPPPTTKPSGATGEKEPEGKGGKTEERGGKGEKGDD